MNCESDTRHTCKKAKIEATTLPDRQTRQGSATKGTAGTALIGLETLSRRYPEFDRGRVGEVAAAIARDERACEAARITALRICGTLGRAEALEPARILSQSGLTMPLRLAAIATLGELGGREDLEYLQAVMPHEAKRAQPVIAAAVKALRARVGDEHG